MIINKKTGQVISGNNPSSSTKPPTEDVEPDVVQKIQVPTGGIVDVFKAVVEILSNVRWEYGNSQSPKIFTKVYLDDGQFERIVKHGKNMEDGIAFPACFVHFINIHWLKPSSRKTEGRCTLRIRYILNRLNIHDSIETESEGFIVGERIKQEFALRKDEFPALTKRCALTYYDQVNSFDNGLQPWWMDFEVWFDESNIWYERRLKKVKLVFPPFVNHSDQTDPSQNRFNHTNADHKTTYDEATKFVYSGVIPSDKSDNVDNSDSSEDDSGDES